MADLVISLGSHEIVDKGCARFYGELNEQDWYKLATLLFGAALPNQENLKAFDTPFGPVNVVRTGSDRAIWLRGDKTISTLEVFDRMLRPLPMRTPVHCGDFYMAIKARGHFQYILRPFRKNEVIWFDDYKAMDAYYADRKILPAYSHMNARSPSPGIVKSWSSTDQEEIYYGHFDQPEYE